MSEESPKSPSPLLRAKTSSQTRTEFSHPYNAKSKVIMTPLSRATGMKRAAVTLARIPPGRESFAYHSHEREEEWLYILSGKGIAEIDGEEHEVEGGDFMGFATPSVAHNLRNAGEDDLVYLMGGEALDFEIADFPHQGKRMIRRGHGAEMKVEMYDIDSAEPFQF